MASKSPYKPRPEQLCNLPRLLEMMERRHLDGIFSYYATNVCYLSGYATASSAVLDEMSSYCAVVISRTQPDHPILIFPDFEINFFNHQPTWIKDIRPYRSLMAPIDKPATQAIDLFLSEELRAKPWVQEIRGKYQGSLVAGCVQAFKDLGLDKSCVGFDNLSFAPEITQHLPEVDVADGYRGLKWARMVKSETECQVLRVASALNQRAIEMTVRESGRGMTWFELNNAYYRNVLDLGGFVLEKGSMILFNPKGSDPTLQISTGLEQDYALEEGMHVMFDCHGKWNRYNWDGGKTWIVDGEPEGLGAVVAQSTAAAMGELMHAARPGERLSSLAGVARRVIAKTSPQLAESAYIFFHGVGLENSDREWGGEADWMMENGMVVSVHVAQPGQPNTRHYVEEVGIVTDHGIERFFTWDIAAPLTNG